MRSTHHRRGRTKPAANLRRGTRGYHAPSDLQQTAPPHHHTHTLLSLVSFISKMKPAFSILNNEERLREGL